MTKAVRGDLKSYAWKPAGLTTDTKSYLESLQLPASGPEHDSDAVLLLHELGSFKDDLNLSHRLDEIFREGQHTSVTFQWKFLVTDIFVAVSWSTPRDLARHVSCLRGSVSTGGCTSPVREMATTWARRIWRGCTLTMVGSRHLRKTLICHRPQTSPLSWTFTVKLRGEHFGKSSWLIFWCSNYLLRSCTRTDRWKNINRGGLWSSCKLHR